MLMLSLYLFMRGISKLEIRENVLRAYAFRELFSGRKLSEELCMPGFAFNLKLYIIVKLWETPQYGD